MNRGEMFRTMFEHLHLYNLGTFQFWHLCKTLIRVFDPGPAIKTVRKHFVI